SPRGRCSRRGRLSGGTIRIRLYRPRCLVLLGQWCGGVSGDQPTKARRHAFANWLRAIQVTNPIGEGRKKIGTLVTSSRQKPPSIASTWNSEAFGRVKAENG